MVVSQVNEADAGGWCSFLIVADPEWVEPQVCGDRDLMLALYDFAPFSGLPVGTLLQLRNFTYERPGIFCGQYRLGSVN